MINGRASIIEHWTLMIDHFWMGADITGLLKLGRRG